MADLAPLKGPKALSECAPPVAVGALQGMEGRLRKGTDSAWGSPVLQELPGGPQKGEWEEGKQLQKVGFPPRPCKLS